VSLGANTYSGTTAINAGTLYVNSSANSFSAGIGLNNGTLKFTAGALGNSQINFSGGTLQWADGNTQDISSNLNISGGNSVACLDTNGNNVAFAHALGGSGGLTKLGAGMLTLGAINTYTGGTTVNGGTLSLATGGPAGIIRGNLTINSGATVEADTGWSLGYIDGTCVSAIVINGGTLHFSGSNNGGGTAASSITMCGGTISGSNFRLVQTA